MNRSKSDTEAIAERLIAWFIFGVFLTLLPLLITVLIRHLLNMKIGNLAAYPEFLFFPLVLAATALNDLSNVVGKTNWDLFLRFLWGYLLVAVICSAVVYGFFVFHDVQPSANPEAFLGRLLPLMIPHVGLLFVVSLVTECLVGRLELRLVYQNSQGNQS